MIHFLNAALGGDLPAPIVAVEILNPYNEREFLDDKLSIVDVKARDTQGRVFQVEIQLLVLPDLPARILYGWANLYRSQIKSGQDYGELRPAYSIWLLGETLRRGLPEYVHHLRMRDEQGRGLIDHGGIWLLELGKFAVGPGQSGQVDTEIERWLKFFTEGECLDDDALPEWMQTAEMQQAMNRTAQAPLEGRAGRWRCRPRRARGSRSVITIRRKRHLRAELSAPTTGSRAGCRAKPPPAPRRVVPAPARSPFAGRPG